MWLVDARKTSLTGVQNSKKNRLAATRLGHRLCIEKRHHAVSRCQEKHHLRGFKIAPKKSARRYAARGRCSASSLSQTPPPPWKKARSAPGYIWYSCSPHIKKLATPLMSPYRKKKSWAPLGLCPPPPPPQSKTASGAPVLRLTSTRA